MSDNEPYFWQSAELCWAESHICALYQRLNEAMLKELASVAAVILVTLHLVGSESLIALYFKENIPDS